MKTTRIIALALCLFTLCVLLVIPAYAEETTPRFNDITESGVLNADSAAMLNAKLDEISKRISFDVGVFVVDDIADFNDPEGEPYTNYGEFINDVYSNVFYENDSGTGAILMHETDGNYTYVFTYGGGSALVDEEALTEKVIDDVRAESYYSGFTLFAEECERMVVANGGKDTAGGETTGGETSAGSRGTIKSLSVSGKPRVVDLGNTGILTESQMAELSRKLDSKSEELQFDIVAVVVDSIRNYTNTKGFAYDDYADFADDFYDYYGNSMYGYGDKFSGALILYEVEDNYRYITTYGEGENAVDFETARDDVVGYFNNNDIYGGFGAFADTCEKQVLDARSFHFVRKLLISLAIALVIAFIVTSSMKSKLTSVKFVNQANNYVRPGSLQLSESRDTYLYASVTRTVRQTESRSGGGGGSHTSSSGRSHGGGGF